MIGAPGIDAGASTSGAEGRSLVASSFLGLGRPTPRGWRPTPADVSTFWWTVDLAVPINEGELHAGLTEFGRRTAALNGRDEPDAVMFSIAEARQTGELSITWLSDKAIATFDAEDGLALAEVSPLVEFSGSSGSILGDLPHLRPVPSEAAACVGQAGPMQVQIAAWRQQQSGPPLVVGWRGNHVAAIESGRSCVVVVDGHQEAAPIVRGAGWSLDVARSLHIIDFSGAESGSAEAVWTYTGVRDALAAILALHRRLERTADARRPIDAPIAVAILGLEDAVSLPGRFRSREADLRSAVHDLIREGQAVGIQLVLVLPAAQVESVVAWCPATRGLSAVVVDRAMAPRPSSREGSPRTESGVSLLASVATEHVPDFVPFDELDRALDDSAPERPFLTSVGLGAGGVAVAIDLVSQGPHFVVGGSTGSGKSAFLHTWITGLLLRHSPDEIALYLIDLKGGDEFHVYGDARVPHVRGIASDIPGALELVEAVHRIAVARQGAKDSTRPRVLLMIDEFGKIALAAEHGGPMGAVARRAWAELAKIAQVGRSSDVHLVLAQQVPKRSSLPDDVRENARTTIAFRMDQPDSSVAVLGGNAANHLRAPGRGLIVRNADGLTVEFQAGYLTADRRSSVLAAIVGRDGEARLAPGLPLFAVPPTDAAPAHIELRRSPEEPVLEVGTGFERSPVTLRWDLPIALASGRPGSGRTRLIRMLTTQAQQRYGRLVECFAADPLGDAPLHYSDLIDADRTAGSWAEIRGLVEFLHTEAEARAATLRAAGCWRWSDHASELPAWLVILENLHAYDSADRDGRDATALLSKLLLRARTLGLFCLGTSVPDSPLGDLRRFVGTRVYLGAGHEGLETLRPGFAAVVDDGQVAIVRPYIEEGGPAWA